MPEVTLLENTLDKSASKHCSNSHLEGLSTTVTTAFEWKDVNSYCLYEDKPLASVNKMWKGQKQLGWISYDILCFF